MARLTRILLDKFSVNIVHTKRSVFISLYTIIHNWSFCNAGWFFLITMEM